MGGSSNTARDPLVIALDRIPSSRIFDHDGHLHVEQVHITKAGVSPYYGREIPQWQDLGLQPDRIYRLLRDPIELERAASTLHNKPLLFGHNPVHAEDHDHQRTVGTVSKPTWNSPYLDGDMACWVQQAIDCVKDDTQKELSSAYHYKAVMGSGVYEGEAFDGRMTNISFNHVALVPKGRVGPDCVVSDSAETVLQHLTAATAAVEQIVAAQDAGDATDGRAGPNLSDGAPTRTILMAKHSLSGAAAHTQGALSTYLHGKLAQDAKVDIRPLIDGLTAKNFKAYKPILALGLKGAMAGKLAKDADLNDVEEVLDRVEEAVEELQETVEEVPAAPAAVEEPEAKDASEGDVLAFLSGKLSEEDLEAVRGMLSSNDAPPAPLAGDDANKGKPAPAQDKAPDMSKFVPRQAMDAAIQRAVADATAQAAGHQSKLRAAERFVRPWVGDLPAMDSEEQIHRAACDVLGIKHTGVHASALPVLIERSPKPGEQPTRASRPAVAQDAAAIAAAEKAFPHMNRLSA